MSTGNEIVDPGQPLRPGQLYDINQFTLASIVEAHGGVAVVYPTVGDDLPALKSAAKTAEVIGTPRSNLYKKLEQYGISQEVDG